MAMQMPKLTKRLVAACGDSVCCCPVLSSLNRRRLPLLTKYLTVAKYHDMCVQWVDRRCKEPKTEHLHSLFYVQKQLAVPLEACE